MKKTIIQFIRGISNGGAETLVQEYCSLINKDKFNIIVVVLFSQKESANYRILKNNNIEIIELYQNWSLINRIKYKLYGNFYIPIKLLHIIKKYKPDVMHIHMTVLRFLLPIINKLKGIRLFYTCHSLPEVYFGNKQKKEYYSARILIKKNGLRLIGLTDDMVMQLNKLFSVNNSILIRNGVDFNRFSVTSTEKEIIRASLNISKESYIVGHVGRFHPVKNHIFLISVFEEIYKVNSNAFLLMIGDGNEMELIKKILHEKNLDNKYLILSNRDDVPRILSIMDVFVFCSLYEGFGMAAIEAQIAGIRTIISDTVPKDTCLTNLATRLNLDLGPKKWAEVALSNDIIGINNRNLNDYNMRNEILRLEEIYIS